MARTRSIYAGVLILGAAFIAEMMRTRTRDAHRHLLLQSWQLRQLVPQTKPT